MTKKALDRLLFLCHTIPTLLMEQDKSDFSTRPAPDKWSKKEILGHLIDSATNNHHRIVRGQYETLPRVAYDNQVWNSGNHYQEMEASRLIAFWKAYNEHLAEVIRRIPDEKLLNQVETGEEGANNIMTLSFVIDDYVVHLEHHLRQLVNY